jgi:hypothetical protein
VPGRVPVSQEGRGLLLTSEPHPKSDYLLPWQERSVRLTGVSLDMNPGGQIPYDRVVNSIRLLAEQVIPHCK